LEGVVQASPAPTNNPSAQMERDPALDMMLALLLPYTDGRTTKMRRADNIGSLHGNLPPSAGFCVSAGSQSGC
jgi:hypothetical protein